MPSFSFLRALIPSWRFFDRAVLSPRLYIRVGSTPESLAAWAPVDLGSRSGGAFAFAPAANLSLAYQSAIDRLVVELGDVDLSETESEIEIETDPRVTELVSYRLVERIARTHAPRAAFVQWKILVPEIAGDYLVAPITEHAT